MARTRTLTNLIADVKSEGGYLRSKVFTDTLLTRWINQAIAEVYGRLAGKLEGHYVTDTELSTVASQKYVSLPSDHWRLLRLAHKHSAQSYTPLKRIAVSAEHDYEDVAIFNVHGPSYVYYIKANTIQLSPTPTKVDTLEIVYIPHSTDLSAGSDTFDGINGYEDLVVQIVLRKCYQREQKDTRPALMEIKRILDRLDEEAARDSYEPMPLRDV